MFASTIYSYIITLALQFQIYATSQFGWIIKITDSNFESGIGGGRGGGVFSKTALIASSSGNMQVSITTTFPICPSPFLDTCGKWSVFEGLSDGDFNVSHEQMMLSTQSESAPYTSLLHPQKPNRPSIRSHHYPCAVTHLLEHRFPTCYRPFDYEIPGEPAIGSGWFLIDGTDVFAESTIRTLSIAHPIKSRNQLLNFLRWLRMSPTYPLVITFNIHLPHHHPQADGSNLTAQIPFGTPSFPTLSIPPSSTSHLNQP
ncbi:hypothetical protein HDU76_003946 [Blyttiomyces sp. JEL0837]|nr:hypothetical protein HDU76_003946 [Blyttiomyces sp. JEL0837]